MNGLHIQSWLVVGVLCALCACGGDEKPSDSNSETGAGTGGTAQPAAGGGGGSVAGAPATAGAGSVATPPVSRAGSPAPAGSRAPRPAGMSAPAPAAGSGGTGSTAPTTPVVPPKDAMPSMGCGAANPPASGMKTIDVDGTTREYIVKIPTDYDPMKPYKLIFAWHGLGGTAMQIAGSFGGGYYGLSTRAANSAIFIAGQGLPTSTGGGMGGMGGSSMGDAGWPNTGGRDVAFVRKLVEWARTSYCIDNARIFSVGMSYGGIMSNTLGCEMGDVFRAIAPMSGSGPRTFGGSMCKGQVAVWMSHGNTDTVVAFSQGQSSRDHWVKTDHCTMETVPAEPSPCVAYQGCDAGFPVTWCEFDGGHMVPPFASDAIWKFLSQF